jgi:hypothetical protein
MKKFTPKNGFQPAKPGKKKTRNYKKYKSSNPEKQKLAKDPAYNALVMASQRPKPVFVAGKFKTSYSVVEWDRPGVELENGNFSDASNKTFNRF